MPAVPAAPAVKTPAETQIERAIKLETERYALQERITANRNYLRLMDANEELNAEQSAWLKVFYPEKERDSKRSKDDIERTRRAREAARKGHMSDGAKAAESEAAATA